MASFCTGTAQLFARLNRNPRYTFWPIEVVTDEIRLHARPRMVSITQALAIDLTGQACCDRIGETLFGGLGSQPEFMRAAARAPAGKPILCLYATDKSGTSSVRLVASACLFGEVTTQLAEVGYLVDPEWQGGGLGRELQTLLIAKARGLGFRGLRSSVAHNAKMIRLAESSGLKISTERDRETCEILMTW